MASTASGLGPRGFSFEASFTALEAGVAVDLLVHHHGAQTVQAVRRKNAVLVLQILAELVQRSEYSRLLRSRR